MPQFLTLRSFEIFLWWLSPHSLNSTQPPDAHGLGVSDTPTVLLQIQEIASMITPSAKVVL